MISLCLFPSLYDKMNFPAFLGLVNHESGDHDAFLSSIYDFLYLYHQMMMVLCIEHQSRSRMAVSLLMLEMQDLFRCKDEVTDIDRPVLAHSTVTL